MIATEGRNSDTTELVSQKIAEGETRFGEGDVDAAVAAFQQVLDINPDDVRAHSNLGVVCWQTGDRDNALKHLNRAHATDPDDKVTVINLAEVYAVLGQRKESLRLYSSYLSRHPDDEEMKIAVSEIGMEADVEDPGDAASISDQLITRATGLRAEGKTDEALAALNAVLALGEAHASVHRTMAEIYRQSGQAGKSVEHLMQAFRMDALDKVTYLELYELLCEKELFDAAIHICETYLTLKPEDSDVVERLEKCKRMDVSKKTAVATCAAAPESDEDNGACGLSRSVVERVPEINSLLGTLSHLGVEIKAILDIGVLHGTPPLMRNFPDLKHYLFEPIDDHFDVIRENYSNFDYELFHVALSDSDGEAWQNSFCNDGSGRITHSHISDRSLEGSGDPRLIKSQQVSKARLDTIMAGLDVPVPYLVKIDVDGHELPILEGARETLKHASAVIIEATAGAFLERANFLVEQGFALFDIVDFAYYAGVLHQVDIVFVRKEILAGNERLRPIEKKPFQHSQWYLVSANRFAQ